MLVVPFMSCVGNASAASHEVSVWKRESGKKRTWKKDRTTKTPKHESVCESVFTTSSWQPPSISPPLATLGFYCHLMSTMMLLMMLALMLLKVRMLWMFAFGTSQASPSPFQCNDVAVNDVMLCYDDSCHYYPGWVWIFYNDFFVLLFSSVVVLSWMHFCILHSL